MKNNAVPHKLVVLETYWNKNIFSPYSVKGFFDAMAPSLTPPLQIAHRFVESKEGLESYTNDVFWKKQRVWNAPVYYLAFHGSPGKLSFGHNENVIDAETLCNTFKNYGKDYQNIVYFSACRIFDGGGEKFAEKFLQDSGCQAVIGYTKNVDWLSGMLIDLLFLSRFYNHENPWPALREIVESVQADFPLAKA